MRDKILISLCVMLSLLIGSQISWGSKENDSFTVSTQADGDSNSYRLKVNVKIVAKSLIKNEKKFAEQIIQEISRNTLPDFDFAYEEKGLPSELVLKIYWIDEDKKYHIVYEKAFSKDETKEIYKEGCSH